MKDNFYKQLLGELPVGYAYHRIICDKDGIPCDYEFIEVNVAFERSTGLKATEIIGKKISEVLPDRIKSEFRWIEFYGDIAINGGKNNFEQYSDDLKKWYRVDVYSPEKYYFVTLFVDITKERAQLSELDSFFEINLDLLCIADMQGNFLKVNKEWANTLGYSRKELLNRPFLELVHPDDMEATLYAMSRLGNQEQVINFVNRYRCRDDSYKYIEWRSMPHGSFIFAAARDITENKQFEKQLKDQKEQFELVIKESNDGIWDWNIISNSLFLSPKWKEQLGYNNDELTNEFRTFECLLHPEDKERVLEYINQYLNGDLLLYDIEFRMTHKDGKDRWFRARGEALRDQEGNLYRMAASHTDITQQKEAEYALRESEEKYRQITENISDVVWTTDINLKTTYISPSIERLVGEPISEYLNRRLEERFPPDSMNRIRTILHEELEKEKALSKDNKRTLFIEAEQYRADGTVIWVNMHISFLRDEHGRPIGFQGVTRDITEHKNAEMAIQEQEKYLRTILETTQDGFWVLDNQGQIMDVNEAYSEMTGYTQIELLGMKIRDLEALEMPEETAARIKRIRENGSESFETRHKKKDGSLFDVEVSVSCIYRDTVAMVCFCRDITERKQMENRIKRYQDIVNHMQVGLHLYQMENLQDDRTLKMVAANPAAAIHTGIAEENIIGYTIDEIFPDLRETNHPQRYAEVVRSGNSIECEDVYYREDKSVERAYMVKAFPLPNHCVGVVFENITERKQMERTIFNEREQFKTTLLSIGDAVISTDYKGNIKVLNKIAEQLTGWTQDEAIGKPLEDVFHIINEFTRERCENPAKIVLKNGDTIELANHTILVSRDGSERPIEDSAAPIKDSNGNIHGVVLVFRDFTEKKEKQDRIIYLSFYDQLTGVYNRRYFEEEFKRLDTERNLPLTLAMLDVNGLKLTNDAFGHLVGDKVLKKVAEVMKKECRMDDIIARIGGDEFVILLPKTNLDQAKIVVERIHEMITREKVDSINLSISYGWETKHECGQEMTTIFKKAEDDMYRRKLSDSTSMRYRTIDIIIKTLFEKNQREENHSKRVSQLCADVGQTLQLSQDEISELQMVGLMHDIGKIAIHEDILNKPSALNDSEWMEIKRHPEIGYRILSSVNEYAPLAEYVLAHHERWDGKGYPKGLMGKEIPLQARIIAVIDAYDAMTGYRPYHRALSPNVAVDELRKNAGSQFDPDIVKVFITNICGIHEDERPFL